MTFKKGFDNYACEGDRISCEVNGFDIEARIVRDDSIDRPDERDEGFWPSRDPKAAGYVPPEKFDTEMKKAKQAMEAWKNDEWFYAGVVLSVSKGDIVLDDHAAALWGIECNHPHSSNEYLSQVAEELLPEALKVGLDAVQRLTGATSDAPKKEMLLWGKHEAYANGQWIKLSGYYASEGEDGKAALENERLFRIKNGFDVEICPNGIHPDEQRAAKTQKAVKAIEGTAPVR